MATNHHVMPTAGNCPADTVYFPVLDIHAHCRSFLFTWPTIDLTLFTIVFRSRDDWEQLQRVAQNFAWHDPLLRDEPLATFGFGHVILQQRRLQPEAAAAAAAPVGSAPKLLSERRASRHHPTAKPPIQRLVYNDGPLCRVLSRTGDYRMIQDPDVLHPNPYRVWSFAHGCDVWHGDSGSPIVNRLSGVPIGLVWTGKTPKLSQVQSSSYVNGLQSSVQEDKALWSELAYGVPAVVIRKVIRESIDKDRTMPDTVKSILADVIRL